MHFDYKSGVSFTNIQLSVTKMAFQLTKWHLVLLLSTIKFPQIFTQLYLLKYNIILLINNKKILQNRNTSDIVSKRD